MPNVLDNAIAYLAATPAAKGWLELVEIRGGPSDGPGMGGIIRGAAFNFAVQEPDPITGELITRFTGMLPASLAPGDLSKTPLAELLSSLLVTQQVTIDAHEATIAAREKEVAEKDARIKELEAKLAADKGNADINAEPVAAAPKAG